MKIFIIKASIIFIFCLLLFRFTIISAINNYERKLVDFSSTTNRTEIKNNFFEFIEEANKKDKILYEEDAKLLSTFINKLISELDLK